MKDIIGEFIARYTKEIDYYDNVARRTRDHLDAELKKEGVRAAVSHRAKAIDRLEEKCRNRNDRRQCPYVTVEEIYDDIIDLAGVRVALYFPSDREIVASAISRIFELIVEPKSFPETSKARPGRPRFAGYTAQHFRVRFKEASLSPSEKHYAAAKTEIQIASVFMHGWSEVEHDLVYKPRDGELLDEEYSLIDQLNGLAIAAEIALENLQKAVERRISERNRQFVDHYELASHLLGKLGISDKASVNEAGLGRMDYLFALISQLKLNSPKKLDPYMEKLHDEFETRPLADQVIDALLAEDDDRYKVFAEIRRGNRRRGVRRANETFGAFLNEWIRLERLEGRIRQVDASASKRPPLLLQSLQHLELLDQGMVSELRALRVMRNKIVHAQEHSYSLADVEDATVQLRFLIDRIERGADAAGLPWADGGSELPFRPA